MQIQWLILTSLIHIVTYQPTQCTVNVTLVALSINVRQPTYWCDTVQYLTAAKCTVTKAVMIKAKKPQTAIS